MSAATTNLSGLLAARLKGPSLTIWLCAATVLLFVLWASLAWVDEIVRADGEMISSSRPQIIQNLEGGILAELAVKEGQVVDAGDVLAKLRSTQFESSVDELKDQIIALDIKRRRLEAEMEGRKEFGVPEAMLLRSPEIVASERALLVARQGDYVASREGAKRVLEQVAQEKQMMENLLKRKIVALIEVTRVRKAYEDARIKYDDIVTSTELERAQEYSDALKEIASLRQSLKASEDQLTRTVLRAPMKGIVNGLAVTTIGGVVRPGEEILQIIPLDEELFVEARVKPENIAGVRRGQEATVKLSAYDYTIYGSLKGMVDVVSADTFKDERARDPEAVAHYKVTVKVDMGQLSDRQQGIEIRPGMQANVELHTGGKTVLSYLVKPLYKSREAFRER